MDVSIDVAINYFSQIKNGLNGIIDCLHGIIDCLNGIIDCLNAIIDRLFGGAIAIGEEVLQPFDNLGQAAFEDIGCTIGGAINALIYGAIGDVGKLLYESISCFVKTIRDVVEYGLLFCPISRYYHLI